MYKKFIFILVFLFFTLNLYATNTNLFVIERSKNSNIVRYDANINNGIIDKENPVDAYWLLYAKKNGEREELSAFDKKAYGFKVKYNEQNNNFDFVLKAVKEKPMVLDLYDGVAKVVIKINKVDCFLEKVYIQSKDGAFGIPKVYFYVLYGTEKNTGNKIEEKIIVSKE